MDMLQATTIILSAAVIVVSLSKKYGLGSILGYVFAGLAIGPWGLNLITDAENILHFSETGVILLLFIIGLELRPKRLWLLRKSILGLGITQVVLTTMVIATIAYLFVSSWLTALLIGFGLSLSSTAFALQLLEEKRTLAKAEGKAALHVLLFQDVAAIPALAIIPIVAIGNISIAGDIATGLIKMGLVLASFWLFARYLLRPIFQFIAAAKTHEIFTAAALLLVLGSALIMRSIGVSMALGAFLAGVLVADSEYRHQLETDIKPFKGLLLGLFFMAVGMSVNLNLLIEQTVAIAAIVVGIIIIKGAILFIIGQSAKLNKKESLSLALYLSQGGEFSFILFSLAANYNLLDSDIRGVLIVAVTLSMTATPLILTVAEKILTRFKDNKKTDNHDPIDTKEPAIILAGAGRFGQIILRILRTQGIIFTAIDSDPQHVHFARRLGNKVYYGDASNKHLLDTAQTASAKIFVLAINNEATSLKIAQLVKREYPNIRLFARAKTRMHEMKLRALGAEFIIRETLLSSIHLSENILTSLNIPAEQATEICQRFYQHDRQTLDNQFTHRHDQKTLIQTSRKAAEELVALFAKEKNSVYLDEEARTEQSKKQKSDKY